MKESISGNITQVLKKLLLWLKFSDFNDWLYYRASHIQASQVGSETIPFTNVEMHEPIGKKEKGHQLKYEYM